MGSLCGGNTQVSTSQQTTTPTDAAGLQSIFNTVQSAAQTPYTPYGGQLTAPVNSQQTAGIAGVNANANTAQPYYNTAAGYAATSGAPLSQAAIQSYMNPYTQSVIDSTQANFNESNGQQQQQVKGNAALSGALGGDRQAVAQAETARQQNLSQAPVIAGLQQANYQQAQAAAQADRSAAGNAAGTFGNLGTAAQTAGLQGAGAQISAGTLQQQTQQAQDQAAYQQYLQQQAFPYQNAQFLSQYGTPAALAQGSSTSGTQTTPGPSVLGQIAGLGIAAAGTAAKFGVGGRIEYASGGATPFDFINNTQGYIRGAPGYIPTGGSPPSVSLQTPTLQYAKAQQTDMKPVTDALGGIKNGSIKNPFASSDGGYGATSTDESGVGGIGGLYAAGGLVDAIHHIHKTIKLARGGVVGGSPFASFADGGDISFNDRFSGEGKSGAWDHLKAGAQDFATDARKMLSGDRSGTTMDNRRALWDRDKRNGYADGGDTTFDDRFNAAYQSPSRGIDVPADDQPFRLAGPEAMDAWRKGVDQPNPAIVADADQPGPDGSAPNPMAFAGKPDASPAVAAINSAAPQDQPDAEPSSAMAYDSTPGNPMRITPDDAQTAPAESKSPFHLSDKASSALIATGLGMLASRSPFAGVALGEGGLRGLASYNQATTAEQEAADKKITQAQAQKRIDFEAQRIVQGATQFNRTSAETARHNKATEEKEYAAKLVTRTDPNTGETDYLTFDPKTKQLTPASVPGAADSPSGKFESTAAPVAERRKAPAASPQARDDSYYEYMQAHRPPGYADVVRAVADYEIDPNREASLQKGARDRLYRDVKQYDPTYDQTHFAEKSGVIQNFARGTASQAVNSLNVSVAHLGTLTQLGDALENGNTPAFNKIGNAIAVQLGRPAPTNFDAAKEIVGDEVVKAVVGGVNSQADREAIKHLIMSQQSPAQLKGVIKTFTALLGGQLDGQRQRYQAGTGLNNFDQKYLSPETREALKNTSDGKLDPAIARAVYPSGIPKEASAGSAASSGNKPATVTQNGHTYNLQPDGTYK